MLWGVGQAERSLCVCVSVCVCVGGAVREAWEKREGDLGEENRVLRGWEKEGVGEPSRLLRTKTRNFHINTNIFNIQ